MRRRPLLLTFVIIVGTENQPEKMVLFSQLRFVSHDLLIHYSCYGIGEVLAIVSSSGKLVLSWVLLTPCRHLLPP